MQKVIVAGATGYLGRFVVQESKKEAIVAVSRKLATIIYSIFKYNTPYNPNRVFTN